MFNKKLLSSIDLGKYKKKNPYKKDIILDPMGQWKHPGKNTRIPLKDSETGSITMKGVNYPVLGIANTGQKQMMQPGQEYNFPGADYVDEYPQMKKGGAKKKYTSDIINSTNYLFAEHPLFKKKKQSKKRIYDPKAKYYQDGGATEYNQLPEKYKYALQNFIYPNVSTEPNDYEENENGELVPVIRPGYNSTNNTITYDPNNPVENINNDWWREHELFHQLQNLAGGKNTSDAGILLQRPNPYVASNDSMGTYYNRRDADVERTIDSMIAQNPDLQFIPRNKLAEGAGPGFIGAEDLQYSDPSTLEGEARQYEQYIEAGNPSIFPKQKTGGQLSKAKYGHSIGNLIRKQNGGQLLRAQFGLTGTGEDRSLSFTPFDFRSSYGQSSDYNRNPNYSLTYTTPKLFKKADLAGNPLSITLGRPYNTDAESLTNRTLNFIPQEGLFSSYYDPATQGGSNPQYQQYLQDVSDTTGTPVSELNQTIINQYNAAKNLAGAKPLYKKGIPLTANVGYDIIGNAFGDSSSGPFTGALSLNAGYAPEPGLYGTADASIMGVFGRRKNNASIKPQRYFDKGLTRQGDMAFIPKLNILNFALRQRPEYNESQTQQILDAYAKDIEQGTTTAKDFITNKTDEKRFDMSFLSPEATFQIKPFKNFPGVASITGGLRLDYGGKETSGDNIPITPKPYGNVRYTVPIEGAIDKLKDLNLPAVKRKKTYNDYANDQEYDEEYTGDTPEEDTPTENNIEVNPPKLQVNPNGTVIGRGDCPEGYERPCPKCRCQKIKMPQMYTDKRGTHLFGNESFQFEDGGVIELELDDDQIEEYRKGGYIVEDISVPSLTRMQPGGLIETAAQLLKQATPGNKVRSLIYSGINPAGYGLKTKLLNFPKELSLTKAANETRPFRVGMSLQNPESLSKFLLRNNMANSDWDALSDLEKMQMMSKPKVDKIVDTGKRRLDAFAVGLKQPQEYGTLEQVGDNTFRMKDISYDPEYFSELYTDILAKNMLDKSGVYLGEDPLVTIAKQHYDRSMHPHLRGLLGIADQTQLGKDAIAKMSKMTRSQIDKLLGYPNRDFAPWKQSRIVELSKINQDPNFKYSIYDNDEFGVMGGFRWDLADTPEGMLWQGNDTWDLNPWQNRGETRVDTDPFVKKLLAQHYRKPLQHLEALSLVGGKPFDIQNNFLIDPGTFKTIKQYQNGGEYGLGDEVDEATMKQLKELGYTFEKI